MTRTSPLTRDAGLARLAAVTSRLGQTYAAERNADPGPEVETSTSALSPYLRRAWDEAAWPQATRGYSRLHNAIPTVLRGSGVPA